MYELFDTTYLVADDDLFVPSLVARGWADHDPLGRAVRITSEGCCALEDSIIPRRS